MTVRVLTVEHEALCPPARLGGWLVESGCQVDVVRPYAGDALPATLRPDGYDALLVLGGTMDAFDDTVPWLADVRRLLVHAAEESVPALGVCLGHQLAALALGGRVGRNPLGKRSGLRAVGHTDAGRADPLVGTVTAPAVFSNQDVVLDPPAAAVDLARTPEGELQAARFAPTVWGVQWHPEADAEVFGGWARHDTDKRQGAGPGAGAVAATVAEVEAAEPALEHDGRALAQALARQAGA
ncbi:type 1 glutamine amidotransferase [Nocardioides litoris]|uniref:type 1 glutamine amidotransferase n=1 Tax=Nocardioides litoris TaxID=1926648 RepID=UPI0011241511|nr:type 1 glutamine amidotransferase [Nocardioides litoris]